MQVRAGVAQQLRGAPEAGLGDPTDARAGVCSCSWPATPGSMRSGANATHTSSPIAQPALGQRLHQQLARAADIGGRGQHQRLSRPGVAHDRGAHAAQDRGVGQVVFVDRRGHADQHQVGRVERLDALGQDEAHRRRDARAGPGALTPAARPRLRGSSAGALVETSIPTISAPASRHRDRGRQPDVAEADDRHDRMGSAAASSSRPRQRIGVGGGRRVGVLGRTVRVGGRHRSRMSGGSNRRPLGDHLVRCHVRQTSFRCHVIDLLT